MGHHCLPCLHVHTKKQNTLDLRKSYTGKYFPFNYQLPVQYCLLHHIKGSLWDFINLTNCLFIGLCSLMGVECKAQISNIIVMLILRIFQGSTPKYAFYSNILTVYVNEMKVV